MPRTLHLSYRDDGVAVMWLDSPDREINVIGPELDGELEDLLGRVEDDPDVIGVIVASAKRDHFCAGADVAALRELDSMREAEAASREAQAAMNRIESFAKPVVAAIHGTCQGAGLELGLACRARVASSDRVTRLGFPEVRLGLIPGAGGTQRLPRLIDVADAIELITSGKSVSARRARELGLVDELVASAAVVDVAAEYVVAFAQGLEVHHEPQGVGSRLRNRLVRTTDFGRKLVFDQARKKLAAKVRGNYPAPDRALLVIEHGLTAAGFSSGLAAEAAAFGELLMGPTARCLLDLFFARRAVQHERYVDDDVQAATVDRIGVVGAGTMGAGIAYVSAAHGVWVELQDVDDGPIADGLRDIHDSATDAVERGQMSGFERTQLMSRVGGTKSYRGFHACPIVIEAVNEDLELKQTILREVENRRPADLIFASNTSSIPIRRIARGAARPDRVIGMHYFSPVERMELLEIAVSTETSPEVLATCLELGRRQGKTPIVVNDGPGFYTTRVLAAYLAEALTFLDRGVAIGDLDRALEEFGFPLGPLALADQVGLDTCGDIANVLAGDLGKRFAAPALEPLLDAHRFGAKNGRGFYRYDERGSEPDDAVYGLLEIAPREDALDPRDIAWRCCLRFVDEAMRCYSDGILGKSRDGDVGAVYGLGFPAFRGGPFRLVSDLGPAEIVRRLSAFDMDPAPLLLEMARREVGPEEAIAKRAP